MFNAATILGNGTSRLGLELPSNTTVYACNHAYKDKDIDADYIVAVDVPMMFEIYNSGYPLNKRVIFSEFINEFHKGDIEPLLNTMNVVQSEKFSDTCYFLGTGNQWYTFWKNDQYKLESFTVPERFGACAGIVAAWHAASIHDCVFMMGFDMDGSGVYQQTPSLNEWGDEHYHLVTSFPDVKFIYVDCKMYIPYYSNVEYKSQKEL